MKTWVSVLPKPVQMTLGVSLYWIQIAILATRCLIQQVRGEEPDCPDCWKCESMRVLLLCVIAFLGTKLTIWVL